MQIVLEIDNKNELQLLLEYVKLLQSVKVIKPNGVKNKNTTALKLLEDVADSYSTINEPDLDVTEILTNRTIDHARKIDFG